MNYYFLPYDFIFLKLFEKEKKYLQDLLGKNTTIEHFGSTSVPGLGGKGVIDIYVLVQKNKMKKTANLLTNNGYLYSDFFKDERHLLFQTNRQHKGKDYHYHIHLSPVGNNNFEKCIKFRDYLRRHQEAAKDYVRLKKKALEKIKGITDKKEIVKIYLETKKSFIDNIIKK